MNIDTGSRNTNLEINKKRAYLTLLMTAENQTLQKAERFQAVIELLEKAVSEDNLE